MYPITTVTSALGSNIVRTGAPIANLMLLGTFLLLAGLMLLRTARVLTDGPS